MIPFSALVARTELFETFIAPARARAALWRVLASAALLLLAMVAAGVAVGAALLAFGARPPRPDALFLTPGAVYATLASFAIWWAGLWLSLRLIHRRPFTTLIGPRRRIGWRRYGLGAAAGFGVALISVLVGWAAVGAPALSRPIGDWALAALPALPLLFIQTGAEELAFRGYLTQQLAVRFRSPLIWALLPALLFGALHWSPGVYGEDALAVVGSAAITGLILTVVTVRTGDLSLAMGLHLGVNVNGLLLVSPGALSGLALARWPTDAGALSTLLRMDLAVTLAALLLVGLWLSRDRRGG